jgi:diphthamide synthase (EF-2-diphthine--ammonia ligase)
MKRVLVSWSSGKGSAWTLHVLRQRGDCEIVGLLTTVNTQFDRVAMHGTRRSVLEAQGKAAGLPLWVVPLPWPCSNENYEQRMREVCDRAVSEGVNAIAFGDLFLADIRAYREVQLQPTGLEPLFPLWQRPTAALARELMTHGLRAKLICVDTKQLPSPFVGREFDEDLLTAFPLDTDPWVNAASFTPACMPDRCSITQYILSPERLSLATASPTPISKAPNCRSLQPKARRPVKATWSSWSGE